MPAHHRTSPRRSRAMTLAGVVVGLLGALAVVAAVSLQGSTSSAAATPVAAVAPTIPAGQYQYALSGSTPTANINSPVLPGLTELNHPMPWTLVSPTLTDLSGLSVAGGTLTCSITDSTGKVLVEKTASAVAGTRALVMCVPPVAAPAVAAAPTTTTPPATTTHPTTTAKAKTTTTARKPSSASDTSYRCTNQIDYSSDPRDNATINSIGAQTGKCPTPIKSTKATSAASSDPWIEGQIEWCKEGHDGIPPSQC